MALDNDKASGFCDFIAFGLYDAAQIYILDWSEWAAIHMLTTSYVRNYVFDFLETQDELDRDKLKEFILPKIKNICSQFKELFKEETSSDYVNRLCDAICDLLDTKFIDKLIIKAEFKYKDLYI